MSSGYAFECLLDSRGKGRGCIFEVITNFEHGWGRLRKRFEGLHRCGPVNCSVARPQVLVLDAVVVVHMNFADTLAECGYGFRHSHGDVRVTQVKTNTDVIKMSHLENGHQMLGRGGFTGEVLNQNFDTQWAGKGSQMFERGRCILDSSGRPAVTLFTQMHYEFPERNVLGSLESTLDLIHGVNAPRLFRMQHVDCGCPGSSHLAIGKEWGMHRECFDWVGGEPACQFRNLFPAGVVKMLARRKNLNCLGSGTRRQLKQTRVKPLLQQQVSRKNSQHLLEAPCAGLLAAAELILRLLSHSCNNLPFLTARVHLERRELADSEGFKWPALLDTQLDFAYATHTVILRALLPLPRLQGADPFVNGVTAQASARYAG